ncbi:hypothetical protein [Streptomyces sp. NBC_00199]|uniref:hypothetical protein n=1 Tax=Streptomyces sp. NBC_00199 TaxID=2975678 RepID=UPI002251947F|nr:hypothetical protein [Streptomyces sp. NBC_00199]MCX5269401.1 hypothetical protein [Streptomyces sp. NBC_00199]
MTPWRHERSDLHPRPGTGPPGATALPTSGSHHHLGDTLRAIRVFAGAAFDVIILGEYGEEAGAGRS